MINVWRYLTLLGGALCVVLLGAIQVIDINDWSVVFGAAIAGFVALSINETVKERRKSESENKLRERREQDYELIVKHLLSSFGGQERSSEVEVRSRIVLWASNDFMQSYGAWKEALEGLSGRGLVSIPVHRKQEIQDALGRVCVAARTDLGVETRDDPTFEDFSGLAMILFDDYEDRSGASRENQGGERQSR